MLQGLSGPQTGANTSAVNQQDSTLLGTPQIQNTAMPSFDPAMLNTTAIQSPAIMNMVKALKGGM